MLITRAQARFVCLFGRLVVVICISFSWFADYALWTLPDAA